MPLRVTELVPERASRRSVFLSLTAACLVSGCAPSDLPETVYSFDDDCLEVRVDGVTRVPSTGEIRIGESIVRARDEAECGSIQSIRSVLYEDKDGNGRMDEGEEVVSVTEPKLEFLRSKRVSARTIMIEHGTAPLVFRFEVETSTGRTAVVGGPIED